MHADVAHAAVAEGFAAGEGLAFFVVDGGLGHVVGLGEDGAEVDFFLRFFVSVFGD